MITVYGRPGCASCEQTVKYLARHNVPYTYIDVDTKPEDLDPAITTLPYVRVEHHDAWTGFRYDKLRSLRDSHARQ